MNARLNTITAILVALTLTACNKSETKAPENTPEPAAQTETNTNPPQDQPDQATANKDTEFKETIIPPGKLSCKNWKSAMFVDGNELYYKIKIEKDGPFFYGEEKEREFEVKCHVKLKYATDDYCGSEVTCELEPQYNKEAFQREFSEGAPVEGIWFIDKNGYYSFGENDFQGLEKASQTGWCKHLKYVKCEPGTLAWEYKQFNEIEPMPLRADIEFNENIKDEHITSSRTVERTGSLICYHASADDGVLKMVNSACIDDIKGLTSLEETGSKEDRLMSVKLTLQTK